jgi:hypothetical protein
MLPIVCPNKPFEAVEILSERRREVKFDVESESFRTFLPAEKFVYHSRGLESQTVQSIAVVNLIVSSKP